MTFTLLMTCSGGEMAPQLFRALKASRRHDVKIIGVDMRDDAIGRHFVDHFHTVPSGTDPDFVDAIGDLAERHCVDLIWPAADEEALALAAAREKLEVGGRSLACNSLDLIRMVSNKATLYEKLDALGVPLPVWRRVDDIESLVPAVTALIEEFGEAVVKPAISRGNRGTCIIRSDISGAQHYRGSRELHMDSETFFRDHLNSYADWLPVVVMERLVEPVYDIDVLAWEGRPVRIVPRRRHNPAGIPFEGNTIVGGKELIDIGRTTCTSLGLSWLYDVDVMTNAAGRPMLLEINPRPSGSLVSSIAAGVPLIEDLISLVKGEPLPEVEVPVGRVVVPFKSLAVMADEAAQGIA